MKTIEKINRKKKRNKMKIQKKKKKKIKIKKKKKKKFRFKQTYRKKFRTISNQKNSQLILIDSILKIKNSRIRNFTFIMKKYMHSIDEFSLIFSIRITANSAHKKSNRNCMKCEKNMTQCDEIININNNYLRFVKIFLITSIFILISLTTAKIIEKEM